MSRTRFLLRGLSGASLGPLQRLPGVRVSIAKLVNGTRPLITYLPLFAELAARVEAPPNGLRVERVPSVQRWCGAK